MFDNLLMASAPTVVGAAYGKCYRPSLPSRGKMGAKRKPIRRLRKNNSWILWVKKPEGRALAEYHCPGDSQRDSDSCSEGAERSHGGGDRGVHQATDPCRANTYPIRIRLRRGLGKNLLEQIERVRTPETLRASPPHAAGAGFFPRKSSGIPKKRGKYADPLHHRSVAESTL